ncbi:hypothetical protein AVEN_132122-1 [Araneus ventricosus]|uniref:Uncharacterized protein n=1 Tax=Araneus ventricosus TaxID=182803 RepID=A0A4Y2QAS2_ARAVE|nr:hypothetical protein AVEN_132122-1 [Araneus ventricosus]
MQHTTTGRGTGHHKYMDEKPPDKQGSSRFPGGNSNGVGLCYLHSDDGTYFQSEELGCGQRCLLRLHPQFLFAVKIIFIQITTDAATGQWRVSLQIHIKTGRSGLP